VDDVWLDTVRLARDCGGISSLFPPGVTRIWDLPFTLHLAIKLALYFLSFEEIMDAQDKPPKRIWLNGPKMEEWWRVVKDRHSSGQEVAAMPQNEALKEAFPGVTFG
jgi:hypothetical protein